MFTFLVALLIACDIEQREEKITHGLLQQLRSGNRSRKKGNGLFYGSSHGMRGFLRLSELIF